jgi:hypothetical protein
MKDRDILEDILEHKINNQIHYNENILINKNPEARHVFTQARDDETRDIVRLQQKLERIRSNTSIIGKIFFSKDF